MKAKPIFLMMAGLCFLGAGVVGAQIYPPAPPPFFEALSAHGTWRNEAGYGWYWRPADADRIPGWRPYLHGGRWQWAGDAWNWSADTVWGATVFHYGRWANVPARGWIWVPGQEYSAAWVQWVRLEGYWGWAPLPPEPGCAPGFALSLALQADDYMLVPEGSIAAHSLELIAFAGLNTAALPQWSAASAVASPTVVSPSTVVVYQEPPLYLQSSTFSVGSSWWLWDDSPRSRHGVRSSQHWICPPPPHRDAPPSRRPPQRVHRSAPHSAPVRVVPVPERRTTPGEIRRSVAAPPPSRAPAAVRTTPAPSGLSSRAEGARNLLNRR